MPSLTRLLNRKSLTIPKSSTRAPDRTSIEVTQPPTSAIQEPAPLSIAPPESENSPLTAAASSIEPPLEPAKTASSEPTVRRVPRQDNAPANRRGGGDALLHWPLNQLKAGKDPLGKGLAILLENGGLSAVYLAAVPGGAVPRFNAKAFSGETSKTSIWTGLSWDPNLFPEIWNYFVTAGFIELAPPGNSTNQMSARNVIRGAFGVARNEYLLILRAGPEKNCRGVLAVVAKESMISILKPALVLIAGKASGLSKAA